MLHGESNRANAMDRRTFARLAGGLAVTLTAGALLGCGEASGATAPKDAQAGAKAGDGKAAGQVGSAGKGASSGEQGAATDGKTQAEVAEYPSVMVTYFSATGHTEAVAQAAAKALGVEPFATGTDEAAVAQWLAGLGTQAD